MMSGRFESVFNSAPVVSEFTPGRVNLIGEHIDYNGGMVLPTALSLGVSIAIKPRADNKIRIWSDKFEGLAERTIDERASAHWSDYILGSIQIAVKQGLLSGGADIAVETTLPFGAGISSSAAVTVGVLKLAREFAKAAIADKDIAVLARRVENEFIGVPCGIMDQMAVAIARPGQALALNTETLDYELIELPQDYHFAVIHSGQFRRLEEGRYKIRKEECDVIKAKLGNDNICQMSDKDFNGLSGLSDILQRRARHCMTEHRRTIRAVTCLKENDMQDLGILMNESHISMRDDFDITVPKVDSLVKDAISFGAVGARMTGGGFGGCIVACVLKDKLEDWRGQLLAANPDAFWVS